MSEVKAGKIQAGISVTPANNFVLDASADDGTLILRDSSGTALMTMVAGGEAESYARDNILGTVSESSGVPTGAIIESGSNANGEYVKYADGTLICWHGMTSSSGSAVVWTFPVPFIASPRLSGIPTGSSPRMITFDSNSPASGTLSVWSATTLNRTAVFFTVVAIGRWF